jgi:hypothetical protein
MQEKTIKFRYKGSPIEIKTETAIKPEMLYGKQKKSIEINGETLEKVIVTPWGKIYKTNAFTNDRLDEEGSLPKTATPCSPDDRSELPILPSSYKTTRLLEDANPMDLLNLKTRSVIPIETTLPPGLYKTYYNYRDSATLEPAILNITPSESFLMIGETTNPPLLKKEETYSFFNEEETEESTEDDLNFSMF